MSIKQVKSVVRVLDILNLFHQEQRAMRMTDIASKLEMPVASTNEILKTMVDKGFFSYGDPKRMFKPSNRFSEIVEWVRESVCDDPQLLGLMDFLNEATQENIILSGQANMSAKIYGSLDCLHEFGVNSARGKLLSPTQSLVGITSLSHFGSNALEQFFSELKKSEPQVHKTTDFNLVNCVLADIRQTGVAIEYDLEVEGIGAICCPITSPSSIHGLVIGIVGPSHRLRLNQSAHIAHLKRALREFEVATRYPINI